MTIESTDKKIKHETHRDTPKHQQQKQQQEYWTITVIMAPFTVVMLQFINNIFYSGEF